MKCNIEFFVFLVGGGELEAEHSDGTVHEVQNETTKCTAGTGC